MHLIKSEIHPSTNVGQYEILNKPVLVHVQALIYDALLFMS